MIKHKYMTKTVHPKRSKYLALLLIATFFASLVQAQFPSTDSLHRYNNRWIRVSAVEAFTNLRLNNLLHGMIAWIDSARAGAGGTIGMDTAYAINDSTVRYRKNGINYTFISKGVYDSRRKVDSAYALNDTILRFKINGTNRDVLVRGASYARVINDTMISIGDDTVIVGGSGAGAEVLDDNSLARANSKLFTKGPVFNSYAAMRLVPTLELNSGFIYRTWIGGLTGEFYYDSADASTADDTAMTIVTTAGKRFKRIVADGWINAKWFGATGNGTTDDYYNLQRGINWTIRNYTLYKKFYIPHGTYRITNGLVVWKDTDANGFPDFVTLEIKGESNSHGFAVANRGTTLLCAHVDNFALAIQFGKGCRVSNLAFEGQNYLYGLTASQIYSGDASLFIQPGVRSNAFSPYSAIVIDPFNSLTASGNRYPRMNLYTDAIVATQTTGSSEIVMENLFIEKFVTGIIMSPNGHSQNAEVIVIRDCWIDYCKDAICNAQSQTRENEVQNLKVWGGVHTIFNSTTYGQANGVLPNVNGMNIAGYNYQMIRLTSGWTGGSFTNVYAELLFRLGQWGAGVGGLPISFVNSYFDIPTGVWYASSKYIGGEASFTGCVLRQYNNRTGYITSGGGNLTFTNCMLSGPVIPYRDVVNIKTANTYINKTKYINCSLYGLPVPGAAGRLVSELNENSDRLGTYQQAVFGVRTAKIHAPIFGEVGNIQVDRNDLPLNYDYQLRGEMDQVTFGFSEPGRTINFNSNGGVASFTSGLGTRYKVNDLLAQQFISTTIDGEVGISSTILGVVSSIVGDVVNIASVPDINATSEQKTNATIYIYQQAEFQEPLVGEITTGSNVIANVRFHRRFNTIRSNTAILHPSFPYYTRIVSFNTAAKTVTLSHNATASDTHAVIEFMRMIGSGSASQEPNSINYTSFTSFDSLHAVIFKGSFIANRGSDTTIKGWMCTRTGFLGTDKEPGFKEVAYHDTRYNYPMGYDTSFALAGLSDNDYITKLHLTNEIGSGLTVNHDATLLGDNSPADLIRIDSFMFPSFYRMYKMGDSIAALAGGGLSVVSHDGTLIGDGTPGNLLGTDSVGTHPTFYRMYKAIDSLALLAGTEAYTLTVGSGLSLTGNGTTVPWNLINTGSPGTNPMNALDIRNFGGIGDAVVPGSGANVTGTNNISALNTMLDQAADGQVCIIPSGGKYRISGTVDTINSKRVILKIYSDTYHDQNDFLIFGPNTGAFKQHRVEHYGIAYGRVNQVSHTKSGATRSSPVWSAYTGTFVKIYNTNQVTVIFNKVEGFKDGIEISGAAGGGGQENTIIGNWIYKCANGISLRSIDGASFVDKNKFWVARVSGGLALKIDGYQPLVGGENYNGAFRSNEFHFLAEQVDSLCIANGDITENEFDIEVEAGVNTGVFGAVGYAMRSVAPNYVRSPKYTGQGILNHYWMTNGMGLDGSINQAIYYNNTTLLGTVAKIDNTGNINVEVKSSLPKSTRDALPANFKTVNDPNEPQTSVSITSSTYPVAAGVRHLKYNNAAGTVTMPAVSTSVDRYVTIYNLNANPLIVTGQGSIAGGKANTYFSDGVVWAGQGDGSEKFTIPYSGIATVTITAASSGTAQSFLGGAKSLGSLAAGDVIEITGSGNMQSAFAVPTTPSIDFVVGSQTIHVGFASQLAANTFAPYKYHFRATPTTLGSNVVTLIEYQVYIETLGTVSSFATLSALNTTTATVNAIAYFNNVGNTMSGYMNTVEVKRL